MQQDWVRKLLLSLWVCGWGAGPADHSRAAGDSGCHAALPAADGAPRPDAGPQRARAHAAAPSLAGEPPAGHALCRERAASAGHRIIVPLN